MKILCITVSRADWGGLGMVAKALKAAGHDVSVTVTGQHTEHREGFASDGIPVWGWLDLNRDGDTGDRLSQAAATCMAMVTTSIAAVGPPDLAIINGDRYEALACAFACSIMGVPIAHMSGGDITEGSLDDGFRDAISALAELHFATNIPAWRRLLAMGRSVQVFMTGSPAIDRICSTPTVSRETFFERCNMRETPKTGLVIFHPVTGERDPTLGCDQMVEELKEAAGSATPDRELSFVVCGTNADHGSDRVRARLRNFAADQNAAYFEDMSAQLFYSAMTHCSFMIGNSSAGIYEAPTFGLPVVNIGRRQQGRLKGRNVIDCDPTRSDIQSAIAVALVERPIKIESPYGDGKSAGRIVQLINEWQARRAP